LPQKGGSGRGQNNKQKINIIKDKFAKATIERSLTSNSAVIDVQILPHATWSSSQIHFYFLFFLWLLTFTAFFLGGAGRPDWTTWRVEGFYPLYHIQVGKSHQV